MVHFLTTSYYSLLESTLSVEDIIHLAKENKQTSVCLSDHNVMYGSIAFYRAAKKAGLKPLIGLTADVLYEEEVCLFTMLAKNNQGYKKLVELSTLLNTGKKQLDISDFAEDDNIIVFIPNENGAFEKDLYQNDSMKIDEKLAYFSSVIPRLYLGISKQKEAFWSMRNRLLKEEGLKFGLKTVVLEKNRARDKKDTEYLKALEALQRSVTVNDASLPSFSNDYYHTMDEIIQMYDMESILLTEEIAAECNLNLDEEKCQLLNYPNEYNVSSREYLRQLCLLGLKKRFEGKIVPKEYSERLKYELDVISRMGYDDYFLIVYDFILYARKNDIMVGPGRGSAAGSLVSYCLGITHIDPIQYGLLFERFLNPERISMPDIDVDFQDDRRQEVIEYVAEKYGYNKVAHIIAFQTMQARAALDTASEALGVDKRKLDYAKRYLPHQNVSTTNVLASTYQSNASFRQQIDSSDDLIRVFNMAVRLEGFPKNITTHACGMVMSNKPLTDLIPLCSVDEKILSTQIEASYLEDLGLLKMDFLGIRNLTIINNVLSSLQPKLDINKIPLNDQSTFDLISNGHTIGVFQLESDGMTSLCMRTKPHTIEEISDTIALYRPGAMKNIPSYLENKNNPAHITYLDERLKDITDTTHGATIYQEQVMKIAQQAAGFSLGKADLLRRAMSKKKPEELLALKDEFIEGCLKNKYTKQKAEYFFSVIESFAGYGFNKSHSVAYGIVAYQMAYLKVHYPLQFLCSMLNNVIGSQLKTYQYIQEAKCLNTKILPVSINSSKDVYIIEDKAIRMPFRTIRGLGTAACKELMDEIDQRGIMKDFQDAVIRLKQRKINTATITDLIDAGAFDEFRLNRASMKESLQPLLRYADLIKVDDPNQGSFSFDMVSKPKLVIASEDISYKLQRENELYGFYLSKHPIEVIKERENFNGPTCLKCQTILGNVELIVHVLKVKNIMAKTGKMAFVTLDDETGSIEATIFPDRYEKYENIIQVGKILKISGKIENQKEKGKQILVNTVIEIR